MDIDIDLEKTGEHSYSMKGFSERNFNLDINPSTTINGTNRFIIVSDFDEVIMNISDKWFSKIRLNPTLTPYTNQKFVQKLWDKIGTFTYRDDYYLNKYLKIDKPEHAELMLAEYFNDNTFYDDLGFTPFSDSFIGQTEVIEEFHILTHAGAECTEHPVNESKLRAIERFKNHIGLHYSKLHVHLIPANQSKGEFLKEKGIKFNTFIDDHIPNLVSVAKHVEDNGYELMMPVYGYNNDINPVLEHLPNRSKIVPFFNIPGITETDFQGLIKNFIDSK